MFTHRRLQVMGDKVKCAYYDLSTSREALRYVLRMRWRNAFQAQTKASSSAYSQSKRRAHLGMCSPHIMHSTTVASEEFSSRSSV